MSPLLLVGVALVYAYVAVDYFLLGRPGMCLAFSAYAVSNLGFVWEAMK